MAGTRHGRRGPRRIVKAICAALLLSTITAGGASASGITNSGGDLRDGWYSNQPSLSPDAAASSTFGQMWDAAVDGQVYAQPLVTGTSVIVATERNQVYSLDAETGAKKWSRNLGPSFPADLIGCADLTPDLGVTATPVIDTTTNTIYLTYKTYAPGSTTDAAYYLIALDASTGAVRSGFPTLISGTAQNAPGITFQAKTELQRPGLLLMNGVVYLGFGGHCDFPPYQGWVFGISTAGVTKARWSAVTTGNGAGIWQSGAGLMSDGAGRLFVSTGNGGSPEGPSDTPSGMFGESIVRLDVQGDGTLKAGDFFAPSDAAHLDDYDADFASGGVTALRDDTFGTTQFPHVGVAVGKAGYVYLLNRDNLGGIGMGIGHGDDVLARVGPYGGVWSRPGVWPGDGGWIAIPTASPSGGENPAPGGSSGYLKLYRYRKAANGTPSLDAPVQSDDAFGFGSGAPIITSDGTTSGTATLWVIWSPDGSGTGGQLRAYDAVPVNGHLRLRRSFPLGVSTKFATPGVGSGRLYVGTRNGHVLAFGAPVKANVQAPATTFPQTTVQTTSTANVKLTISGSVKVTAISASPSAFVARTTGLGLGGTFADGSTITVPVDFTPTAPGSAAGTLTVTTDKGVFTFSLNGVGQATAAVLTASPPIVSFGGAVVGTSAASVVTFGNGGGQSLTITGVTLPGAPFSVDSGLAAGTVIAPGQSINVTVHYQPTAVGDYSDDLTLETTAGEKVVGLSGSAGTGPKLSLSPSAGWAFGSVTVGQSKTVSLTIGNTGGSPMTITKSKPPTNARFAVLDALDEATVIAAGTSKTLRITFTPAASGTVSDAWIINAGDGSGVHTIAVSGTGVAPAQLTGPAAVAVPDTVLGSTGSATVTFGNDGDLPLTISGLDAPGAPFAVTDAPAAGTTIAAGGSRDVHVTFSSSTPGAVSGSLTLRTSAGSKTVALSANAITSGALGVDPDAGWAFGDVPVGQMREGTVTLRNAGPGVLRVLASEPPAGAPFTVEDPLPVGTEIPAGGALALRVAFAPVSATDASSAWRIATTSGAGSRMIALSGRGTVVADPDPPTPADPIPSDPTPTDPTPTPVDPVPVAPTPPVTAVVPSTPELTPAPVGPDVSAQSRPTVTVTKLRPDLAVAKARLSRDGRKLTVRSRVSSSATGSLSVRVQARVGHKTVTTLTSLRLRAGHASYTITLVLPKAARAWTRLEILARFPGSDRVWPGTGSLVLLRGR
ncbi:MAG: legume lectin beta domain protein [Conexibacter sp.]|nr:legume lectin beta domain protein [Conexibacter sp.]